MSTAVRNLRYNDVDACPFQLLRERLVGNLLLYNPFCILHPSFSPCFLLKCSLLAEVVREAVNSEPKCYLRSVSEVSPPSIILFFGLESQQFDLQDLLKLICFIT